MINKEFKYKFKLYLNNDSNCVKCDVVAILIASLIISLPVTLILLFMVFLTFKTMETQFYKVVKIFRISQRRQILRRGLTLEEAKRVVNSYPNSTRSMVVFYRQ